MMERGSSKFAFRNPDKRKQNIKRHTKNEKSNATIIVVCIESSVDYILE